MKKSLPRSLSRRFSHGIRKGSKHRLETVLTKILLVILFLPPLVLYIYRQRYHNVDILPVAEIEPWESPIIHILNTRFMQDQPTLTTLARARLHLFKTICLPSILHQTYHDFLWIIKVDPELDSEIKDELIQTIHEAVEILLLESERRNTHATYDEKNDHDSFIGSVDSLKERIFVIGSNENFGAGNGKGSWRGGLASTEILSHHEEGRIYMGNVDLLRMAQKAEPEKIVLETRLDADDGINEGYIAHLHHDAMKNFRGATYHDNGDQDQHGGGEGVEKAESLNFKWLYWCIQTHFKWYLGAEGEYGQLGGEKRKDFCVTPGLTVGYNIGTSVEDVPTYGHHKLFQNLRGNDQCVDEEKNKTDKKISPCIKLVGGFIGAVRARTPTSTGMDDVKRENVKENSDELWDVLEDRFDIMIQDAIETKQFFVENMKDIAKENLEGQCQPGHSCKQSSQNQLREIIENLNENENA